MRGCVIVDKNAYTTKQVADNLGIVTSTLRKYCLMLEDEKLGNYRFERNEKDQRIFYDHDVIALRLLKKLTQEDGITLENAVKTVGGKARNREEFVSETPEESETPSVTVTDLQRHEDKLDQILEYVKRQDERIEQQERFNRELITKLDEQNRYIKESIDRRDQKLMEAMREVQETKQIAAAHEEDKKGFWSSLFGRKNG
jgi:DNA-binding transcriptional MerR regulator